MDIENYLTGEEKKQMESLMKKAAKRRRQRTGKPDEEVFGMYFEFKLGVGKKPEETVQQKAEDDGELQSLLGQLYDYCKAHGYDRQQEDPPWMHEIDEELPILWLSEHKKECERYYQVGRMSMLFALVDNGKLTLDEAADLTGMTWGDAADMLQGWRESQKLQERGERYREKLMDWKLL